MTPDNQVSVNGRVFLFEEFIYGRPEYNPDTWRFPDDVHRQVWRLYRSTFELPRSYAQ
jgi:hypothetical protein